MASRAWRPKLLNWQIAKPFDGAEQIARQLGTGPLVGQILANRGITDLDAARAFMNPSLNDLHDPSELPGAVEAAERIAKAVAEKRRIIIYGDYDVDGITAVAILHSCLAMLGSKADYYIPHRLEEGYGISDEAIDKITADGTDLLITVDCGISASEALAKAADAGMEVIVTDHHSPPAELPSVAAIVHPALPGSAYPNKDLAGAGVAFKLAWQLARQVCGKDRVDDPMREFLLNATCLAALGTIADVVPLVGENRSLAMYGLKGLPSTTNPGLRALLVSANLANEKLEAYHVGFVLAPRINACGRMGHARLAVELLIGSSRCKKIADELTKQNTQRQLIQQATAREAVELVESRGVDQANRRTIVLFSEDWHGGVIGVVASRLVDQFAKPTVLITLNGNGVAQGSARSVPGFHMRDALAACSEHLISFGGHAMAGGIRARADSVEAFANAFEDYACSEIGERVFNPTLNIDAECRLDGINLKLAHDIAKLAPFGQGNPRPVLAIRGCKLLVPPRRMGRAGRTLGLMLGQGHVRMRGVGFGMGELADRLVGINAVDIAAEPTLNTFNGRTNVELKINDIRWD